MKTLQVEFRGHVGSREDFLEQIRLLVGRFTGDGIFHLDALIVGIAKNIWDHSSGHGHLSLTEKADGEISFEVRSYSAQTNGEIDDLAETLNIDLKISTSVGLCYSGTYSRQHQPQTKPPP